MNKKVYIQPQIFFVPLQTESLLQTLSKPHTNDNTGGGETGPTYGGPGNDLGSKEHFNDFDSWDSWD